MGTSARSPGHAYRSLTAACSGPSRRTPIPGTGAEAIGRCRRSALLNVVLQDRDFPLIRCWETEMPRRRSLLPTLLTTLAVSAGALAAAPPAALADCAGAGEPCPYT